MAKPKNTIAEIAESLRKHRGMVTYSADELGCHYHTVLNRIEGSKELQQVMKEVHDRRGDTVENILILNLDLAERKAKKLSKDMADVDDVGITKLSIDKEGVDAALKVAKMKHQDRGYVEKSEVKNEVLVTGFDVRFFDGTDKSEIPSCLPRQAEKGEN